MLERAGVAPGDLVVLPEMFDTGFSFNLDRTEDREGRTLGFLGELAERLGATVHGSRTVVGPDGKGRNCATVMGPEGRLLLEYQKVHPFSYGKESEHFTGGDRVETYVWKGSDGARTVVGPSVCYDLRFPELYRLQALMGAEVLALGANWPAPRKVHRRALAVARAIENQAYVICVNRAGRDPFLTYEGGSVVVDPKGAVVAEAGEEETVLSVDLDLAGLRAWRAEFPALRDVRLMARATGDAGGPGRSGDGRARA